VAIWPEDDTDYLTPTFQKECDGLNLIILSYSTQGYSIAVSPLDPQCDPKR
jgi:hypothetical protein